MKLNCKRIDFTYTPGEEIFNFPGESGLPFIFDVEEELTGDPDKLQRFDYSPLYNGIHITAIKHIGVCRF